MDEGPVIPSARAWRQIEEAVRRVNGNGTSRFSTPKRYAPERGFQFVNRSGLTIPPWGVIAVTGVSVVEGVPMPKAERPDGCCNYYANADDPVSPGGTGWTQKGPVVMVRLHDRTDVPAYGDMLGPHTASWAAYRHRPGLRCLGVPTEDPNVALAIWEDELVFKAKAYAAIAADASGQAILCDDSWVSRTDDAKYKLDVKNDAGVEITTGARLYVRAWKWDPEYRANIAFLCQE